MKNGFPETAARMLHGWNINDIAALSVAAEDLHRLAQQEMIRRGPRPGMAREAYR
jgi:hypothetical protein